jgi:transposase
VRRSRSRRGGGRARAAPSRRGRGCHVTRIRSFPPRVARLLTHPLAVRYTPRAGAEPLAQIDAVEETIARFDAEIARACAANEEEAVVELLDTIPGIARGTAELLVAAIGTDMSKFPPPAHLAAWAGLAPGNHERAGRQRSGRTRKGNRWLRTALVAAAQAAARTKHSYLGARYRHIAARRGAKRAILAMAHSMLIIAYHLIARREPYRELGADYFDRQQPAATANRLMRRLRQLGYDVTLTTASDQGTPVETPAIAT